MKLNINLLELLEEEIREISRGDEELQMATRIIVSKIDTVEEANILIVGIMLATRLSREKFKTLLKRVGTNQ